MREAAPPASLHFEGRKGKSRGLRQYRSLKTMTRALNLPLFDIVKSSPPGGGRPRTGRTQRKLRCHVLAGLRHRYGGIRPGYHRSLPLCDTRRFAGAAPQVIELGAPDLAPPDHLDRI